MKDHKSEWEKWFKIYSKQNDDISQYRARCILGLMTNKTYDCIAELKPVDIPFIK